jgi:hypothetical protein
MWRTYQSRSAKSSRNSSSTTDELEDKKLNIIGWKGPKTALQAIKDAAKSFAKEDKE